MAKINLIIADRDNKYIQGLANYFSNNYSEKFNITCFTDVDLLISFLKSDKKSDFLLINNEIFFEEIKKYNIKAVLITSDIKGVEQYEGYPVVNKYMPGRQLYENIIKTYVEQSPENLERIATNNNTKIITFYSPVGGIGKTSLAFALSRLLGESGKSVLYLNLEDIQSTDILFEKQEKPSFSDFIYFVKERNYKINQKILEIIATDEETNIKYFNPTESCLDVEELDKEDMKFLLETLISLKMFSYIIIDTSSKYNSQYRVILNSSDKVILPMSKDGISLEKVNVFLSNVITFENYYFLINKSRTDIEFQVPEIITNEGKIIEQYIPYDVNISIGEVKALFNNPTILRAIQDMRLKLRLD